MYHLLKLFEEASPRYKKLFSEGVVSDFLIYAVGSFLLKALSLFALPFLMRIFTPSEYGALSLATAFCTVTTAIIGLGLRQLLSIEYFHHEAEDRVRLINQFLVLYTVVALPIVGMSFLLKSYISTFIFMNTLSPAQCIPLFITVFFFFYGELLYQLLQYNRKSSLLLLIQTMLAAQYLCTLYYCVWIVKWGITGVLWAQTLSVVGASLLGTIGYFYTKSHHHIFTTHHRSQYIGYLRYSIPFIPGIICSWILATSDRWILARSCSLHAVGIYSVADLFAQLFNYSILVPWASSYLPYIMKRFKQNSKNLDLIEKENRNTMLSSMAILFLFTSIGIFIARPIIQSVLPLKYHESIQYIWFLLVGQIFLLGSYFAAAFLQFKKRTLFLAFALLIPALINIILNLLLVQSFGIMGCTLATTISYAIYFGIILGYNMYILSHENSV